MEDVGQGFLAADADLIPALPFTTEVVAIKRAERTGGLIDSGVLESTLMAQSDDKVEDISFPQTGDRAPRKDRLQLPDPGKVTGASARGDTTKLDMASEILIPPLGGEGGTIRLAGGLKARFFS